MQTKTILISCVNYNSNDKLLEYLESINKAFFNVKDIIKLDVLIGDNSSIYEKNVFEADFNIIHINNKGNYGYIGGVTKALEISKIDFHEYDFMIISNVDITLDVYFFKNLLINPIDESVGWIAPAIISGKEKRDRNPARLLRPTKKQLNFLLIMFSFRIIHYLYLNIVYKNRKRELKSNNKNDIIYAGHGSIFIFSRNFLCTQKEINFPGFLFGEELFFAELMRENNLKTVYLPNIIVYDFDHYSTSQIRKSILHKYSRQSLLKIRELFFVKSN